MRIMLICCLCLKSIAFAQGTIVFSEDFQQGIPATFSLINLDLNAPNAQVAEYTNPWISVVDPENTSDTVAAATSFFETPDTANRWLITPAIALGSFGNYMTWNAKSQDASYPDSYLVLLSNTDNQTASFTDTLGYFLGENFEWTSREINLTAQGYDNQTIYLAFVLRSYDAFKLYLDDIEVRTLDNTGVNENNLSKISVYPNPARDEITVLGFELEEYQIIDLSGKIVYQGKAKTLDIRNLLPGIYTLRGINSLSPTRFVKL